MAGSSILITKIASPRPSLSGQCRCQAATPSPLSAPACRRASACMKSRRYSAMDKRIPADEGTVQPAPSLPGTATAVGVGVGNADNGSGPQDVDEYGRLLAALGRTEEHDHRIAVHE